MNKQEFVDRRMEKLESILDDTKIKGLEWGILAVLVQIAIVLMAILDEKHLPE